MEREARHGTDPVSHEASSVVVFDSGPQLAFLTVHIYVLTHRATLKARKINSIKQKIPFNKTKKVNSFLPGKNMGFRMSSHGRHPLRRLNRVDRIRISRVHEPYITSQTVIALTNSLKS